MTTKGYKDALRKLMQQDGMGTMVMRQPLYGDTVRITLLLTMGDSATLSWAYGTGPEEADDHTASEILARLISGAFCTESVDSYYAPVVDPLRLFLATRIDAYVAATRLEISEG